MPERSFTYGPVPSRRLGFSLGIDVIPYKICTLDCIYCQVGFTTSKIIERKPYVDVNALIAELEEVLQDGQRIDYLTFSVSGEPTLNSQLGEIISRIRAISDIPVAVLTNGTLITDPVLRKELSAVDLVVPSLDAASQDVFEEINRPHESLKITEIIDGLVRFRAEFSGTIWLEIMLVRGVNDFQEELDKLKAAAERIQPDRIHLNTVVRPPAAFGAEPMEKKDLEKIQSFFGPSCEIAAEFKSREQSAYKKDIEQAIILLLQRRPVTLDDMHNSLGYHKDELIKYVQVLEESDRIKREYQRDKCFFCAIH